MPVKDTRTSYPILHGFIVLASIANYVFHVFGYHSDLFVNATEAMLGVRLSEQTPSNGPDSTQRVASALALPFAQAFTSTALIATLFFRRIMALFFRRIASKIESFQVFACFAFLYLVSAFLLTPQGMGVFGASKLSADPYWLKLLILTVFWPLVLSGSIMALLEPSILSASLVRQETKK